MKKKKNGIYTGLRKTLQDREVILSRNPPPDSLSRWTNISFYLSLFSPPIFFFFPLLMSPIISLVENKRTDIDGIQHRGEIHASLMEMNVSLTSRFVALKLNHATIVEGSAVLTSTAISKNNLETKVVQFPLERGIRKITHPLKLF